MLPNSDLWLLILVKKGEIDFEDIKKAIDEIDKKIEAIFEIDLHKSLRNARFEYNEKDKHLLFHLILNDLDRLCKNGWASVAYESDRKTGDILEKFKISPKGELRVAQLIIEGA